MPQLYRRHICACLALCALGSLTALADPPVVPSVPVAPAAAQRIVLQNVIPIDLIKTLHWDQAPNLPAGVTQVLPLPTQNALAVTATPDGFAKVREMVKILDVVQRQVQVNFALAQATDAELKRSGIDFIIVPQKEPQPGNAPTPVRVLSLYASGPPAAHFLQMLTKQKAVSASTIIAAANYVNANWSFFDGSLKAVETFAFTPRVNSDNSVTLALDVELPEGAYRHEIHTLRTVQSGDTFVVVMPPASLDTHAKSLLLFVTPTAK